MQGQEGVACAVPSRRFEGAEDARRFLLFRLLAAGVADREEELTGSFLPLDEGVNELHHQLLLTSGQDSRLLESAL